MDPIDNFSEKYFNFEEAYFSGDIEQLSKIIINNQL